MFGVLLRRDCETHSEDLVAMEAEVGTVKVQVKNSKGYPPLLEATRGKESFLQDTHMESGPADISILHFWTLNMRELICCLKPLSLL